MATWLFLSSFPCLWILVLTAPLASIVQYYRITSGLSHHTALGDICVEIYWQSWYYSWYVQRCRWWSNERTLTVNRDRWEWSHRGLRGGVILGTKSPFFVSVEFCGHKDNRRTDFTACDGPGQGHLAMWSVMDICTLSVVPRLDFPFLPFIAFGFWYRLPLS
jgi:hypothetical protein